MNENEKVLKKMWLNEKYGDLSEKRSNIDIGTWSELFYFVMGSLTNFLIGDPIDSNDLQFSAKYLDLLTSVEDTKNKFYMDSKLCLYGAVLYYLAGYPGASNVLLKNVNDSKLSYYELILLEVLSNDSKQKHKETEIGNQTMKFLNGEIEKNELFDIISDEMNKAYQNGTDDDVIAIESIFGVIKKEIEYATIELLPHFSNSSKDFWIDEVRSNKVVPLLWSSQKKLGEAGVFDNKSAVIQMPTGTGKTASISLILRSKMAQGKLKTAIVVVPFKSIRDEIFNKLKHDFNDDKVNINKLNEEMNDDYFSKNSRNDLPSVLIVTPEKLMFLIHVEENILDDVSTIIFDEAHQLDAGERGVTFELLQATLDRLVDPKIQRLFISAVIGNPQTISEWFNSGKNIAISSVKAKRYSNTYGFAKWDSKNNFGNLFLIRQEDAFDDGWVKIKNIIQPKRITKNKTEPNFKRANKSTALRWETVLLTEKFSGKGMVAVFVPRKDSLKNLANEFVTYADSNQKFEKNILNDTLISEKEKISMLLQLNFGSDNVFVQAFKYGVFVHDRDIPLGIRNSIEYAARKKHIGLLLCTTTLSQGVNLPIKTMIVTSLGNGKLQLKSRDINNLIGRVGRSGIVNEGNTIFVENNSKTSNTKIKTAIITIMNNMKIENLGSSLLDLFVEKPVNEFDYNSHILTIDEWFNNDFLDDPNLWIRINIKESQRFLEKAYLEKAQTIEKIENFLMSFWEIIQLGDIADNVDDIAKNTYAYHIANEKKKELLIELFHRLYDKLVKYNVNSTSAKLFSRTLCGINDSIHMNKWVSENIDNILYSDDININLVTIWPYIILRDTILQDEDQQTVLELLKAWINGESYELLVTRWKGFGDVKIHNKRASIESVVSICEQDFQYNFSMYLSSLSEMIDDPVKKNRLIQLQESVSVGLAKKSEKIVFGLGINDRYLARKISEYIGNEDYETNEIINWIQDNKSILKQQLNGFLPAYFTNIIDGLKSIV